jgi:PEP-CTERM motif
MFRFVKIAIIAVSAFLGAAGAAQAGSILVGDCVVFGACWTSATPTAWSDSLSGGQLAKLGLGSYTEFLAGQTSYYNIRLGVTTMEIDTTTGFVTEQLGEFNGGTHFSCTPFCEVDTVGYFYIPSNAISAVIYGTFGNSSVPNSSGVCLFLGNAVGGCRGGPVVVPEPSSLGLLGSGIIAAGFLMVMLTYRRRRIT